MKIALCLHGYFDSFTDSTSKGNNGYRYIKKHILNLENVDVYLHSWQPELTDHLLNLYHPVSYKFEPQIDFEPYCKEWGIDNLINPPRPPHTVLSHFYSIEEVFKLLYGTNNKYDLVIKSRYDLGQINRSSSPNHVECINLNLSNDLSRINMAHWPDKYMLNEGPPDMWFYGNQNIMESFSKIFDNIQHSLTKNVDYITDVTHRLGRHNLTNASVLYKQFFEDFNLWETRSTLLCQSN